MTNFDLSPPDPSRAQRCPVCRSRVITTGIIDGPPHSVRVRYCVNPTCPWQEDIRVPQRRSDPTIHYPTRITTTAQSARREAESMLRFVANVLGIKPRN